MTYQQIIIPGLSDDDNRTLNLLMEQLEAKQRRNKLRDAYYDMKHAVRQVGSVIPPQYWKLGIVLGWAGAGVDALARRCNLDGFTWSDGDLDSIGYRDVWDDNDLGSEVDQGTISSLIHCTAFVINTLGDDDEPESLIHFKDAMNATGEWNGRKRRLDSVLSITSRGGEGPDRGKPAGIALYLDGRTITAAKDGGRWEIVDVSEHDWHVPADPLPYKPRLNRPFGSSRITRAAMSLQDQAVRSFIRLEGHNDIYAIPDLWMFGADEDIFKNADGSKKESWQVVMGRIKGIPDNDDNAPGNERADVKHVPAASPEPHLSALNAFAKAFAREMKMPDTSFALADMANPNSAESYVASREDLIAEAEGATDGWRAPLRRAMIRALAIKNGIGVDDVPEAWKSIDTKWRPPIYLSRAQEADAGMKQLSAVPWLAETEVGLELLGLDAQQIERAQAEKRRAAGATLLDRVLERQRGTVNTDADAG